jgi:hypothetical protein
MTSPKRKTARTMGKRSSHAKRLDKKTAEAQNAGTLPKTRVKQLKHAKKKEKGSAKRALMCSATDSEDIIHDMLAAAATGGGRFWKKKQKQLDKKEGLRRESATAQRAASMTMERRAAMAVAEGLAGGAMQLCMEPVKKCFWQGGDDGGDPSNPLKLLRKGLGIRVVPGPPGCPPPVAPTFKLEKLLPDIFKAYFSATKLSDKPTTVQRQAWPVLLSGRDCLCVAPTGSGSFCSPFAPKCLLLLLLLLLVVSDA